MLVQLIFVNKRITWQQAITWPTVPGHCWCWWYMFVYIIGRVLACANNVTLWVICTEPHANSMPYIWGLWCQKQVSQAGISNCIPQFTVGCNYLPLPEIPVSGTNVLICGLLPWALLGPVQIASSIVSSMYYQVSQVINWETIRYCHSLINWGTKAKS